MSVCICCYRGPYGRLALPNEPPSLNKDVHFTSLHFISLSICGLNYQIRYYFFVGKHLRIFCTLLQCKRFSHFFNKKLQRIFDIYLQSFNETLTNDVVNFEQLTPGCEGWGIDICSHPYLICTNSEGSCDKAGNFR